MRSTEQQEETGGEQSECGYEIVPSASCRNESTSLTQSTCTNVLHQLNLRVLHKRVAQTSFTDESVDSASKVFVSATMSASLSFEVKDFDIS